MIWLGLGLAVGAGAYYGVQKLFEAANEEIEKFDDPYP